jgi:hypothetical protein
MQILKKNACVGAKASSPNDIKCTEFEIIFSKII